ncbi:MAG TPA: hypothetical protein VJV58_04500 [Bradyrhizobium sp.]|uniref:hypothetical protein n=1 Tax=Bradyrhizobium sp. TaxID=376 RepID=UPI002B45AD97|nr:hypothetical protein [Bradyrhizobium sp.]HKO70174.1 hypothetical protein [Bradyrhizobium sp.]
MIEQLNKLQLRVRARVDPQLDSIALLAKFQQATAIAANFLSAAEIVIVNCMLRKRTRKLGSRGQASPDEPEANPNHNIGETGLLETSRRRVARRQNQKRHVGPGMISS